MIIIEVLIQKCNCFIFFKKVVYNKFRKQANCNDMLGNINNTFHMHCNRNFYSTHFIMCKLLSIMHHDSY